MTDPKNKATTASAYTDEEAFWDAQDRDDESWSDHDDWYAKGQEAAPQSPAIAEEATAPTQADDDHVGIDVTITTTEVTETVTEGVIADDEGHVLPVEVTTTEVHTVITTLHADIDVDADLDIEQLQDVSDEEWEDEHWEREDEAALKAIADAIEAQRERERAEAEAAEALEAALAAEAAAAAEAEAEKDEDDEDSEVAEAEEAEAVQLDDDEDDEEDDDDDLGEDDDDDDEDEEPPAVDIALPTVGGPGQLQAGDPGWVASFVGTRGIGFVFLFAFLIFAVFSGDRFSKQSSEPHFVYLADVLLKQQWALNGPPKHWYKGRRMNNDWAKLTELKVVRINQQPLKGVKTIRGKWYYHRANKRWYFFSGGKLLDIKRRDIRAKRVLHFVSFPPMPAFLMAAPMWVLGKLGYPRIRYNDTIFSLVFSALAVLLLFLLLQQLSFKGISQRSLFENLQLAALFAFGTTFFYVSAQGTVWFAALVVGAVFSLAFLWLTFDGRWPFLAGVCVAAGFLTRPLLVLLSIFFLLWVIREDGKWVSPFRSDKFKQLFLFALPVAGAITGMMLFNYDRFGNPMEFGHTFLPAVFPRAMEWGLFSPHWFPRNVYAHFLLPPEFLSKPPYVRLNAHGLSMFITTPALLLLFWTAKEKRTALFWSLVAAAGIIMLPQLFYQNTGWVTFGNRFSIDYLPLLFVALAVCGVTFRKWWSIFLLWAIALNAFGAATFNRQMHFYKIWPYGSLDWIFKLFS